jgi:peptidoglycan/LPS O-acetylase OafA/YrhL
MDERWAYFLYLQNIPFAARGQIPEPTGYLWSMAVEEQYYLFWPLVVLALPSRTLQKVCLATIPLLVVARFVLVYHGATFVLLYVTTLLRMDALLLGSFLALHVREPGGTERLLRLAKPVFLVSLVVEIAMVAYKPALGYWVAGDLFAVGAGNLPIDRYVQAARFTAHAIFAGSALVLIAASDVRGWLARFFASHPLRTLGKYSYATYMFHVPLLLYAHERGLSATRLPLVGDAQWPRAIVLYLALLTTSVGLAALSWKFFERPFLQLKRFFPYEKAAPAPALVPAAAAAVAQGAVPDDLQTTREVYQAP